MSGDVFGNGMLLSEHIRLVAAFDHRHVFVDPDPDAAASFAERQPALRAAPLVLGRLRPDAHLAGRRGLPPQPEVHRDHPRDGAWPRHPQGRRGHDPRRADPRDPPGARRPAVERRHRHLRQGLDRGPPRDRRPRQRRDPGRRQAAAGPVVGEGGNLGLSQLGRIEAALCGVRVNTDAIDNSAGVDTSDHEVNIKILLGEVVRAGGLTTEERNELLASMTDDVAAHVLRDNYEQNVLLGNARAQEHSMASVHERLMHWLEDRGDLDRGLEFLPSDAELEKRAHEGLGLKSPEFAVLVAYAKLALKQDILASSIPDDPYFERTLAEYFPPAIRERYAGELAGHPLRREIITNSVVNSMVNRGGITFAYRAAEEAGATPEQVARAFVVCREVFRLADFVREVEALDNVVPTAAQTALYLEFRRLLDRSVRWFLTSRPSMLDIGAEIERFSGIVRELGPQVPTLLSGRRAPTAPAPGERAGEGGGPGGSPLHAASLLDWYSLLDISDIATDTGRQPIDVAPLYYLVSERFGIDAMLTKVTRLPRDDRWDALARGALRDDLYAVLESLTRSVIEVGGDAGPEPEAQWEAWEKENKASIQRSKTALSAIRRLENPNIAALSVALRTLRSVIRVGAST